MAKLFKSSKQIFAFVMAFAIVVLSLFTTNITASACDVSKVDYWDGTKATSFESGEGTVDNPYIIKTAEQLAFCCLGQNPDDTTGKYYKVDDSVKIFVMQPESIVNLETLMGLDSAEATKEYLTGLSGVKNWQSQFNYKSFNGNFDGNGATVYGLYADGASLNQQDVGLFPQFDGGYRDGDGNLVATVCKNIAVKNSYYKTMRRLGAITGAAYGPGYGAKIDGKVTVDSCAVINCYMEGVANSINWYQEEGIVVGGGNGDIIEISNILVKGTYAFDTVQNKRIPVIGSASNAQIPDPDDEKKKLYVTKVSNSVFLGVAPYQADHYTAQLCEPYIFTNVVTDAPSGSVTMPNPAGWGTATSVRDFTDHIFQITDVGFDFQKAATMLDWENTWFMSEEGPELRAFHGEITFDKTNTTHVWTCADCGLTSPGGVADHDFALVGSEVIGDGTDVYECTVCGHTCQHNEQTDIEYDAGNCVTASGYYSRCKFCDWYIVSGQSEIPGHKLTYVEADPGHCEKNGHKEYWECSVCLNKFASDNIYAPMDSFVTDEQLDTGLGGHIKAEDENGVIVLYDSTGHWYKCEVDGGRLNHDSNVIGENEVVKHKFKDAACIECDYVCVDHDFEDTNNKVAIGDCFNDEKMETKCKLCGFKSFKVTKEAGHEIVKKEEVKPNDQKEGTKSHYKCDNCKAIFADAEGKKPITKAELVIPKTLPAEYDIIPQNADTSNKSPSTGDSLTSVLAMATLATALIVTSKIK